SPRSSTARCACTTAPTCSGWRSTRWGASTTRPRGCRTRDREPNVTVRAGLASKLTIAFAAVAVVPIAAAALVAQELVDARYRGDYARALDGAEKTVWREYDAAGDDVAKVVKRIARADDPVVGQVLLDLGKGDPDEERERALVHRAPDQMRAFQLDVFEL